mmetsp:Transcript_49320/g.107379  ORF Transcript_49320/g.107379 Transcript_49320/m.107379 type:complete len:280 (+) Transcript_49320:264-1103(+)
MRQGVYLGLELLGLVARGDSLLPDLVLHHLPGLRSLHLHLLPEPHEPLLLIEEDLRLLILRAALLRNPVPPLLRDSLGLLAHSLMPLGLVLGMSRQLLEVCCTLLGQSLLAVVLTVEHGIVLSTAPALDVKLVLEVLVFPYLASLSFRLHSPLVVLPLLLKQARALRVRLLLQLELVHLLLEHVQLLAQRPLEPALIVLLRTAKALLLHAEVVALKGQSRTPAGKALLSQHVKLIGLRRPPGGCAGKSSHGARWQGGGAGAQRPTRRRRGDCRHQVLPP